MISLLQCPVPLSTFASRTNEKQSKKKNSSSAPRLSRSLRPRRRIIGRRPCRRLNTLSSVRACACVCTKKKEKKEKKIGEGTASLHTHSEEGREGREMEGHRANETNNNQRNKKTIGHNTPRVSFTTKGHKSFLTKHHDLFTVVDVFSEDVIAFDTRIYSRTSPESGGGGARRLTS